MVQLFYFYGANYEATEKPLDFQSQINQLKSQGMVIEDDQVAEDVLRKTNYYRFTGYALQFRVAPNQSDYIPGTSFNNIHSLYLFDEALRDICRRYIEIAEVYYRTQISYGFSMAKCTVSPYDQHYHDIHFYNKDGHKEVMLLAAAAGSHPAFYVYFGTVCGETEKV